MTKEQREQWQQDLAELGENAHKMWQYLCMEDQANSEYWADCISNRHFPLSKGTLDVRRKDLTLDDAKINIPKGMNKECYENGDMSEGAVTCDQCFFKKINKIGHEFCENGYWKEGY